MGCLLGSHFTKSGCSTIYKLNRNFHYFSWHTCFHLATAQREPDETEEALRGATGREAAAASPATSLHTSCVLSASLWPLPLSSARAIYSQHSPGEERTFCITCPRWCESSTEHYSHLRSHGTWHGEITPCVIGWPPQWHGVTIMMAWGYCPGAILLHHSPTCSPCPGVPSWCVGVPARHQTMQRANPAQAQAIFTQIQEHRNAPVTSWCSASLDRSKGGWGAPPSWVLTWTHFLAELWPGTHIVPEDTEISHLSHIPVRSVRQPIATRLPLAEKMGPEGTNTFLCSMSRAPSHFSVIFQSSLLGRKIHFKDD